MREYDALDDDEEAGPTKKRKLTHSASRNSLDQLGGSMDSPDGSLSPMSGGGSEGGGMPLEAGGAASWPASKGGAGKSKGKKVAKVSSPLNSDDEAEARPQSQGTGLKTTTLGREDEDDEEENLDLEFGKYNTFDPDKMRTVLAKFTPEQMDRYECYRRSGFQRATMRKLLTSVAGTNVSIPVTIVMSGIAKMFVGELVEAGRIVMTERKETGPIRPCHIREAYRRLKLEGKVPLRSRPRLFR